MIPLMLQLNIRAISKRLGKYIQNEWAMYCFSRFGTSSQKLEWWPTYLRSELPILLRAGTRPWSTILRWMYLVLLVLVSMSWRFQVNRWSEEQRLNGIFKPSVFKSIYFIAFWLSIFITEFEGLSMLQKFPVPVQYLILKEPRRLDDWDYHVSHPLISIRRPRLTRYDP